MGIDDRALRQMHPAPEQPGQPVARLACAVVHQALDDLSAPEPQVRRDAIRFFRSDAFPTWAGFTGLNVPAVRRRLLVLRLVEDDPPGDTRRVIGPTRRGSR